MTEALTAHILQLEHSIPKLPKGLLLKQACKFHNARQREKAARLDDLFAEVRTVHPQSPERELQRVVVNYLRLRCEAADPQLAALPGQREHFELYAQAKDQILKAIAAAYPWLAPECERQNFI